jgi:hypothetical protein
MFWSFMLGILFISFIYPILESITLALEPTAVAKSCICCSKVAIIYPSKAILNSSTGEGTRGGCLATKSSNCSGVKSSYVNAGPLIPCGP